jgi:hypothetical protein
MTILFELGISSADAVTLYPTWDMDSNKKKMETSLKTLSGKGFVYKWGDYERWILKCEYYTVADAAIVNSWHDTNTELLFFITSDSITEVHSVRSMGKDRPFTEYQKPYTDKMKGKIILETY